MSNSTRWLLFALALWFVVKLCIGGVGWSFIADFPGNQRHLEVYRTR